MKAGIGMGINMVVRPLRYDLISAGIPKSPTTFSRASTGTYWDANGVLQTADVDELRLTHDPANGELQGLLIEGQRTNSLLHNRDLLQGVWTTFGGGVGQTKNQTGIDGVANTAWTLTDSSGAGASKLLQIVPIANDNATYSAHVFFKKTSGATNFPAFGIDLQDGTTEVLQRYVINTDTGGFVALSGNTGTGSAKVIDAGEWWQVVVKATNNTTGNVSLEYNIWPAINDDASATSNPAITGSIIYDYGQVELESVLESTWSDSSPILTGASAATRSRDIATVQNLDFLNMNEGTFVVEMFPRPGSESGYGRIIAGDGANSILNLYPTGPIAAYNGINLFSGNTPISNARNKAAFRYSGSQRSIILNGGAISTDSNFNGSEFADGKLYIGMRENAGEAANSPIKNIYYIPRALSDGELQAVTAL